MSDKQKVEFIEYLKALKNDAPLTSYYLLTYLEQEGNTLTDDERSALLETPHGDNYDYEDDHENAQKELMDQMTEEDAAKILENFEGIIKENYKQTIKKTRHSTMHQQSELDASVPPIQIVSHQ